MKKKQLFAVLLAGSMTVGMAPAAAFAAEDTGAGAAAAAEAQVTDDNTDNTTDATDDSTTADAEAQKQAEADAQAAAQAQAEAEAQAAAEAEAQKQAEEQAAAEARAQAEAEAQAAAQAQAEAEEQAAAEAAEKGTIVTTEAELHAAIKAATAVDTSTTAVTEAEPAKIVISGTIELTGSVTIPANKSIAILGADTQASIERADSFKGNLFEVSAGSALYMAKKDATKTDTTVGTLTVDGSVTDGSAAEGSLVHVAAGANFSLTTGVTLANNNTTARGAAIFNEGGSVLLTGGTITGNKCDNGAVYSTGTISVKKGEGATDSEPSITDNKKVDGTTLANIILSGEGKIEVKGEITDQAKIGFSVESPAADLTVITKADETDTDVFAAALKNLASQYEGDTTKFTVDETTGKLVAAEVTKPVVSIESTEWKSGTTATAVITSDKDGQLYYKWVAEGAEAPTFDISKDGESIKAGEKHSVKLENLTGKKVILYVQVKDSEGNLSEVKNTPVILSETPKQAPKITKAAFSKWNSISEAVVTITSDKAGHYYYKSVKHGTKVTSIDTSGKGTEISANNETSIKLSNLDTKTSYDVYVCVKDSDGLVSDLKKIELNQSERPTPKPTQAVSIDVKWTGFQWTAHDSASVTLRTNVTGTCYYTWVERGDDGTSSTPKKDAIKNKQAISKDKNFTIYLNDLDTD